jgi:hypothetical protein
MKRGICSNCGSETGVCTHCWKCAKCCECEKPNREKTGGKIKGRMNKGKEKE